MMTTPIDTTGSPYGRNRLVEWLVKKALWLDEKLNNGNVLYAVWEQGYECGLKAGMEAQEYRQQDAELAQAIRIAAAEDEELHGEQKLDLELEKAAFLKPAPPFPIKPPSEKAMLEKFTDIVPEPQP